MSDTADVAETPNSTDTNFDVAKRIGNSLALRARIAEIETKHEAELKPFRDAKNEIDGMLLDHLNRNNVKSMSAPGVGTIMINERRSAVVEDTEAFRSFVVNMGEWDLADMRANAPKCADFTEENGSLPPGVKLSTFRTLGVRKASNS